MAQSINITENDRDMLVAGLNDSIAVYRRCIDSYKKNYSDGAPECVAACRNEIKEREGMVARLQSIRF